jgi:hypothetical protein
MMSVTVPDVMFDAAAELALEPVPLAPLGNPPAPANPDGADAVEDD